MTILFTICGRAGSKGIKNKNISNFIDKPLAYYTISAIDLFMKRHPENHYDVACSTDSQALIDLVMANNMVQVDIINRPKELSGDNIGKIDVIRDCWTRMENTKTIEYDTVIDLDITSPLRRVVDIENLLEKHNKTGADVTTSAVPARRNPYFNQVTCSDRGVRKVLPSHFTSRQQAPEIFDLNASLYAYNPKYLSGNGMVMDGYVEIILMRETGILDLDHNDDIELMEVVAQHLFGTDSLFAEIRDNIQLG